MKAQADSQSVPEPLNQLTRAPDKGAAEQIRNLLASRHPAEIADVLESFPHGPREILWELVSPEERGEALLQDLPDALTREVLRSMNKQNRARLESLRLPCAPGPETVRTRAAQARPWLLPIGVFLRRTPAGPTG